MNHDYAHCFDWCKNCPKECFRAQLAEDLEKHKKEFIGIPLTYSFFYGTDECVYSKEVNKC